MKRIFYTLGAVLASFAAFAQSQGNQNASAESQLNKLTDKFNVYLNSHASFNVQDTHNGEDWHAAFRNNQLRLEVRGNLTDKLFYRFRHRLNKANAGESLSNFAPATDMMYVGYHINDQFSVIGGKQCQAWGGFEFDLNPMNIYEYSDFIENMSNFTPGVTLVYNINPNHELQFQVMDSHNQVFEEFYGDSNEKESKTPLTYLINWNGSLFNGVLLTRWAAGLETESANSQSYMLTLGTQFRQKQFQLTFDYMHATQQLDRLGIATDLLNGFSVPNSLGRLKDVHYDTFILKAEYQPAERWNIFAKGMYETTNVHDNRLAEQFDGFRTAYGYFAGVEYIPLKDQDLRLYLAYIGRSYEFSDKFQNYGAALDGYNTNRVSLGLIYRIKAF